MTPDYLDPNYCGMDGFDPELQREAAQLDYRDRELADAEAEVRVRCAFYRAAEWLHTNQRLPTLLELVSIPDRGTRLALAIVVMHDLDTDFIHDDEDEGETE